ncbi:TraR/DksA family transcriptional regulator [Sphaerotilus hippei]|uniref:TraR/DksA family transcriptional regulator n=1 Tax=Sphaerotilus hippei TaxID=744406 RepID=A0A318GV94_9BURK|nr:TraR/DksA C4-type zinc finger protein [Sphaerotilus hippei]PXW92770.1 TraR/DksA family transcriptional regulator [Sphaerotilus hippei]
MTTVLDPPRRAALRQALLQQREALLDRMATHQGDTTRIQHAREVLEQAQEDGRAADADREVDLVLTDHDRLNLAHLSAALQRMDHEGYGVCVDCGCEIAFERLLAQPQALRCVPCEQRHEGSQAGGRGFPGHRPATL